MLILLALVFEKRFFFFEKKNYFFELSTIFSVLRNSISPFGLLNPLVRIILTLRVHCQTSMSFTPNFLQNVYLRGRSVSDVTFIKLLIFKFSNFVICRTYKVKKVKLGPFYQLNFFELPFPIVKILL